MKCWLGLALVFVLVVVGQVCAQRFSCGTTGRWVPCTAHCQANCEARAAVKYCTKQCEPGCLCNPGYIRLARDDGRCVRLRDCSRFSARDSEIFSANIYSN